MRFKSILFEDVSLLTISLESDVMTYKGVKKSVFHRIFCHFPAETLSDLLSMDENSRILSVSEITIIRIRCNEIDRSVVEMPRS